MIEMDVQDFPQKTRAIVMFGPATPSSGMRPGEFYQVTIDPTKVSPSGKYIYFGANDGDQIHGWQRIQGLTVCEVLATADDAGKFPESDNQPEPLRIRMVK